MVEDDIKNMEKLHCHTYVAPGAINIGEIAHVENLFPGNFDFMKQFSGKDSARARLLDDSELRDCINQVISRITANRSWFSIIKVLMQNGQVMHNDFEGGTERIHRIFPAGLPKDIDVSDLHAMHVGSFTGPFNTWKPDDGPVKREAEFKKYFNLAKDFDKIVKERLLF